MSKPFDFSDIKSDPEEAYHEPKILKVEVTSVGAKKFDAGKARHDLIPPCVPRLIAEVLEFGTLKYGPNNWAGADADGNANHDKGLAWSKMYAGLQRHLNAWWEGVDTVDPETGKSHLAHALCQLSFLAASEEYGIGTDDRYDWRESRCSDADSEECATEDEAEWAQVQEMLATEIYQKEFSAEVKRLEADNKYLRETVMRMQGYVPETVLDEIAREKLALTNPCVEIEVPQVDRCTLRPPCDHGLKFDVEEAKGLAPPAVRLRWPRIDGVCPLGCGFAFLAASEEYGIGTDDRYDWRESRCVGTDDEE